MPNAPPDANPIRILLVEDNPGDANLMKIMLAEVEDEPFQLEWVECLSAGIARAREAAADVILLDLSLPDSRGAETFDQMVAAVPHLPIIVLSGFNDETMAINTVNKGAQDYLVKGHVDAHLLARSIRYAIERKKTQDELSRYTDELKAKNRQMENDLELARDIQRAYLPQQYPAFPAGAAPADSLLQFCHRYQPTHELGGDFFSVMALSGNQAGILVCDVMGHGVQAALVTAMLRGLVEEMKPYALDAGRFLTEINHGLTTVLNQPFSPTLTTACYLQIDATTRHMHFASAGHPSPLWLQRDAGIVAPLFGTHPTPEPALGLFDDAQYTARKAQLAPRDMVMLFTDGLFEVQGVNGEDYGEERLHQAVLDRLHLPAAQLLDELLDDARDFSQEVDFPDDVCIVGVEMQPAESSVRASPLPAAPPPRSAPPLR